MMGCMDGKRHTKDHNGHFSTLITFARDAPRNLSHYFVILLAISYSHVVDSFREGQVGGRASTTRKIFVPKVNYDV